MDPPLCAGEQMPEFGMEKSDIAGQKKFETQLSAGKVMLTVFWDSHGPILEHYQERGTAVNSAHYIEMLRDKLKPAI
jgi:hypothetical protein